MRPDPMARPAVDPEATVHALVAEHPELHPVLERLGIHVCCGGDVPLAVAAERDGVSLDEVLAGVLAEIRVRPSE